MTCLWSMPDSSPLRGASLVNGEFEVGFHEAFERQWVRAETIGRWWLVAVVAVALTGALGGGPLGHARRTASDGSLTADYEHITRTDAPSQVTLHLHPTPLQHIVVLHLSKGFLVPMGLQTIWPQPVSEATEADGLVVMMAIDPTQAETLVRVGVKPTGVGWGDLEAHLDDHTSLHWTQVILP